MKCAAFRSGRREIAGSEGAHRGFRGFLHVFVKPVDGFPVDMLDAFAGFVGVAFVREQDQPGGAAVALDGLIESFALHGERAGVVVSFAIDRKSTRLNSSHSQQSRMPSSA